MRPVIPFDTGTLRPLMGRDTGFVGQLLVKPEVRRFLCDDKVLSDVDIAGILSDHKRHEPQKLGLWVIETATGMPAGLIGLAPLSGPHENLPEMAGGIEPIIALEPHHWGQGLARKSLSAIVEYARDGLGLASLVAVVDAPNESSRRLLQSCGFRKTGKTRGLAHDLVLYRQSLAEPATG